MYQAIFILSAFLCLNLLTPDAASWDRYTYDFHVPDEETEHTFTHM